MITSRLSIMLLLVLLTTASISAGSLEHNLETGNEYYSDGDYENAIVEYQKILQAGYYSSQLYYNLGNAYFRDGQLGLAILYYTRARQLSPRDDDIIANLDFARQFTIDKIEITEETILLDYVNRFFDYFSLNEIIWLTAILYILSAGVVFVRYIYRWLYLSSPAIITLLALFAVSVIITAVKIDRDLITRTGVIVKSQAEVRNGPGDDFGSQFTAHAGLMFKIEREETGYYLVSFENRLKGWVLKSSVAQI